MRDNGPCLGYTLLGFIDRIERYIRRRYRCNLDSIYLTSIEYKVSLYEIVCLTIAGSLILLGYW